MNIRFDGMTAVVTGGANGIGLATAQLLQQSGATVTVFDRESCPLDGVQSVRIDLTDAQNLNEAFSLTGPPAVLVINAGCCLPASLHETTAEIWRTTMSLNLDAAFFTLQAGANLMRPRRQGAIVVTASTNSFDGESNLIAYNASKAALLGIVHSAANELGPCNIRVNAVCPGLIETRLTAKAFDDESILKPYFAQLPLGRGGTPRDVANAIAFLASPEAAYITGTTLTIDGGQLATKFATWPDESATFVDKQWKLTDV